MKKLFYLLYIFFLKFGFGFVSLLVYISNGSAWLVNKKIKVGALILSLTGIFSCGSPPKPTCYAIPPSKEYSDSIANVRKQDSIKNAEKQKLVNDSIANVNELRKKDSLVKIKHKKKTPIIKPVCYRPAPKTCYAPVKN